MKFGVGVLGATGYIGTPYRQEIRECGSEARIVALCARREDLLRQAAELDGAETATSDWRQVVAHPDVNVVLVATPDDLHHEAVLYAVECGKHVICEKPVALNAEQAGEMWAACRDAGLAHYVPFWTRYVPVFARARDMVNSGRLGDVRVVIYRWHNPRPPEIPFTWRDDASRSAAGSVADVGSHAYDAVRWILNREASQVLAHAEVISSEKPDRGELNLSEALARAGGQEGGARRRATAVDFANITWKYDNGAVGNLILSHAPVVRKGFAPELELHGTTGSLAIDRVRSQLLWSDNTEPAEFLETVADEGFGNRFQKHVFPALRAQLASGHCDAPSLEDGYRVQQFTDAVMKSVASGGWVRLT